jgi:hypothetical protein
LYLLTRARWRGDRASVGRRAQIAFAAQYGASGVMTFVVNHEGVVYEKDLGPGTAALARRMTAYDPDDTWKVVK